MLKEALFEEDRMSSAHYVRLNILARFVLTSPKDAGWSLSDRFRSGASYQRDTLRVNTDMSTWHRLLKSAYSTENM